MLRDFFHLNEPFDNFSKEDLIRHLRNSDQIKNVRYEPNEWLELKSRKENLRFENVSLSKTTFEKVTFKNCHFEDCLFIGSKFIDVQFHQCKFRNCNFYKSSFENCYIDPSSVEFDGRYKKTAANVAVHVFQNLLDNSSDMNQSEFVMHADIRFRQWKRAQIKYDKNSGKIDSYKANWRFVKSYIYEIFAGFGYKPFRFFAWTVIAFLGVSIINHIFISEHLVINGKSGVDANFIDSMFYSFSILTILGFSTITPNGEIAKLVTVFEALVAIGWLGILTALLVKRFTR